MRTLAFLALLCAAPSLPALAQSAPDAAPAPRVHHAPKAVPLGEVDLSLLPRAPEPSRTAKPGVVPNVFLETAPPAGAEAHSGAAAVEPVDGAGTVPSGVTLVTEPATDGPSPDAQPAIDVRFDGVSDGWIPPDPTMAAGRNHVVELINARVAIYNKNGTLAAGPFTLESFFGIPGQFFDFDPLAIYDPFSDRYIVACAADWSAGSDSRIYVAFSQTGDATGAWNKYFIDADSGQPTFWADYPSVGLDRNAVYFTANMFGRTSGFNVTLFVYDKEDGYAGRPLDNTHLIDVRGPGGLQPYRLRPAMMPEVMTGDPYFFTYADSSIGSNISVFRLTGDRFSAPTLASWTIAAGTATFVSSDARQPAGTGRVPTLGTSVWNSYVRNGRLWTAQSGKASFSATDMVSWAYRIDVRGATPVREQVYQVAKTGADLYMAHVVPDIEDNDFALLTGYSSTSVYPTGLYTNVSAAGVQRASEPLATGITRNDTGRYGDYFAVGADGVDPNRLWFVAHSFHVGGGVGRIASVRFEDVPAPTSPPPVPDGKFVTGVQTRVFKSGANVQVTWDATKCPPGDNHLVWFALSGIANYPIAATTCDIGLSGAWTGAAPAGSVGVVVVSDDNATTEGSYGRTSAGTERPVSTTACGQAIKNTAGICP